MELKFPREYIIAARLADPKTRSQAEQDSGADWCAVLKALVKNRVPLNSLDHSPAANTCPLYQDADFQKAARAEYDLWKGQRDEYGELRQALLEKEVPSVLLKSSGLKPSFPYTSDNLDTLVPGDQIESSRQALNTLGYVELRNIEEPQKWLFRKFKGGESVSAVHLHGLIGWGVPFADDAALWKRARCSDDDPWVMVPAPEDALLITIAHAFYENKSLKLLDIARIRHCLHQPNLDFREVERIARIRGWEDGLAFCFLLYDRLEAGLYGETLLPNEVLDRARSVLKAHKWVSLWLDRTLQRTEAHFPFHVSFFLGKVIYYLKVLKDTKRPFSARLYDVITTLFWGVKHIFRIGGQRGMIVSFDGIDGGGKTVHCQALSRAFETSEIKTRIYWSRFGSTAQKPGRLPESVNSRSSDIAASLSHRRKRLQNPWARFAWLFYNLFVYIIRINWNVRLPRWFGGVVICDRYIYSSLVEIRSSLPAGSRWNAVSEWLLVHLCPRPRVAWLLDTPAGISLGRQSQEKGGAQAIEELEAQRSHFASLAKAYGIRPLPTTHGLDESSSKVVHDTLIKYYENYATLVNAVFLSNPDQRNPKRARS